MRIDNHVIVMCTFDFLNRPHTRKQVRRCLVENLNYTFTRSWTLNLSCFQSACLYSLLNNYDQTPHEYAVNLLCGRRIQIFVANFFIDADMGIVSWHDATTNFHPSLTNQNSMLSHKEHVQRERIKSISRDRWKIHFAQVEPISNCATHRKLAHTWLCLPG